MTEKIVSVFSLSSTLTTFHFQHSLRPFLLIHNADTDESMFLDLTCGGVAYPWESLEDRDLYFYETEEDECCVAVIGEISY